jgi:hypothetical protein
LAANGIVLNGVATSCDFGTKPDVARTSCIPVACEPQEYVDSDGKCQACAPYLVARADRAGCEEPRCLDSETVSSRGRCEPCPPRQKADKSTSPPRDCVPFVCDGRRIYQGANCRECEAYTYPREPDRTSCTADSCQANEKLTEAGTCEACPPYTAPTPPDRTRCSEPICSGLADRITSGGACVPCPPGTQPSRDRRTCIALNCNPAREIERGGRCQPCPAYSYPSPARTECVSDSCNIR